MADAFAVNGPKLLPKPTDARGADKKAAAKDLPNGEAKKIVDVGDFNPVTKKAPLPVHANRPAAQETADALGRLLLEDIIKKEPKKDDRRLMSGIE